MLHESKEAYGFISEDKLIEEINSVGKVQFVGASGLAIIYK